MNTVAIIGNLGGTPTVKESNGKKVAYFRLALNTNLKKGERTDWFDVVAFNRLAEVVEEHLDSGDRIAITGRLASNSWIGKDEKKRYSVEIQATRIDFLRLKRWDKDEALPDGAGDDDDIPF